MEEGQEAALCSVIIALLLRLLLAALSLWIILEYGLGPTQVTALALGLPLYRFVDTHAAIVVWHLYSASTPRNPHPLEFTWGPHRTCLTYIVVFGMWLDALQKICFFISWREWDHDVELVHDAIFTLHGEVMIVLQVIDLFALVTLTISLVGTMMSWHYKAGESDSDAEISEMLSVSGYSDLA